MFAQFNYWIFVALQISHLLVSRSCLAWWPKKHKFFMLINIIWNIVILIYNYYVTKENNTNLLPMRIGIFKIVGNSKGYVASAIRVGRYFIFQFKSCLL